MALELDPELQAWRPKLDRLRSDAELLQLTVLQSELLIARSVVLLEAPIHRPVWAGEAARAEKGSEAESLKPSPAGDAAAAAGRAAAGTPPTARA